jgi:NitT/TauT family transport system substrate-binding protein
MNTWAYGAALLLIALLIAGFTLYERSPSTQPIIRAATLQGGISTLDVMESTGTPSSHGFRLQVIRLQKTTDIVGALVKGDVDVAVIPAEMAGKIIEENGKVVVIDAEMLQNQAVLFRGKGSIPDLRGKKIGALLASGTYKMFKAYAKIIYNITVSETVEAGSNKIIAVNILPGAFLQALHKGDVDAVVVWEPFVSKGIVEYNITNIVPFTSLWEKAGAKGEPVMLVWVANRDFAENHPSLVSAFIKARRDAADFWVSHSNETKSILMKTYKLTPSETDILYKRVRICRGSLSNYIEGIENVWKLAWIGGYLNRDPSTISGEVFWSG